MANNKLLDALLDLPEAERLTELRKLSKEEQAELRSHWKLWARQSQVAPEGDWRIWLIMAGRGFGKTRAGAEWVRAVADADPAARIALVGASLGDARAVMIEGESGILAVCAGERCPAFEPSLRRLTWPNGAQATVYSALEPESLRGPQHSHAWWANPEGGFRERKPRAARRIAPSGDRGGAGRASSKPKRRAGVARCDGRQRRMDRAVGQDRSAAGRQLAVRPATGRAQTPQPGNRPGTALCGDLEGGGKTRCPERRDRGR